MFLCTGKVGIYSTILTTLRKDWAALAIGVKCTMVSFTEIRPESFRADTVSVEGHVFQQETRLKKLDITFDCSLSGKEHVTRNVSDLEKDWQISSILERS